MRTEPGRPHREQPWDLIHDRIPPGGRIGPPTYVPAARRCAIGSKLGGPRDGPPATIIGVGADELAARDLGERQSG